ncbi:hypothetical protein K4Q63_03475 [Staphylococcus epidermidis]|nr:hypothetical protein [Staphylococcus epidermidis]
MAGITKEQVSEFIRNNDLDWDESYPRSEWWKFRDERDAYKKQRDELINDMAEVKRKAEAFDEILDINIDKDELMSEEYIEKVNDVVQEWIYS